MTADIRASLTKTSTWTRLIYMILFGVAFNVAEMVIAVVAVVQFFTVLLGGEGPNRRLQDFGGALGAYLRQVISFLTYESDEKPFPIGAWPETIADNGKVIKTG